MNIAPFPLTGVGVTFVDQQSGHTGLGGACQR